MARAIRFQERRKYCYQCGHPWDDGQIACPKCGSMDFESGTSRPTIMVEGDHERFGGPWQLLPWPPQGTVGMYGGPGSGKSSLASMINPKIWISKEQEPRPIADMWRRVRPDVEMPEIKMVNSSADVERALVGCTRGPVVLDSATALGLQEGLAAAYILSEWAKTHAERVLIIIQVTSDGSAAGYNEIPHLVDAVVNIAPDPWGVRAFRIEKSRWSPLDQMYWSFSKTGQIEIPTFEAAYSVEGGPGNYHLHPYPLSGAKWHGINAALSAAKALKPGAASSAVVAPYMPSGFIEPMDALERRRFAEANGLDWISADDARRILEETHTEEEEEA